MLGTDLEVGGVPHYLYNLAAGLAHYGRHEPPVEVDDSGVVSDCRPGAGTVASLPADHFEVHVACLAPPGAVADDLGRQGIPTYGLGARSCRDVSVFWRLARLLNRVRPDILHCSLLHANIAGRLVGALCGTARIVTSVHTAEQAKRWHLVLENATCRLSDVTVCVSSSVYRHMVRRAHYPASRLRLIANGIDLARFAGGRPLELAPFGLAEKAPTVGFVGRLDPVKNVDILLRALAEIHADPANQREETLQALIAGDGPEKDALQNLARDLGLAGRVHFTGMRRDVERLLGSLDVFILPSRWEGLPLACLEAMAAERPVIASRTEGLVDVIDSGRTGILVEPSSVSDLAGAIRRLVNDPTLAGHLGRAAGAYVRRHFARQTMVDNYAALYRSLLRR
ncbi:MAG: glycosyltransferase [Sedimentisphaerales bacterium]|nr:glycosyltransferase [Sedimentisphaerales bacterium]